MRTFPARLRRSAVPLTVFAATLALCLSAPLSAQATPKRGATAAALDPSRQDTVDVSGKLKGMKLDSGVHLVHTMSSGTKIWAIAKDGKVVNWVVIDRTGRPLPAIPVANDDCFWCWLHPGDKKHPCVRVCGSLAQEPKDTRIR
jgi:hypothetical protein